MSYWSLEAYVSPRFTPEHPAPGAHARALALQGYRQARSYSCGFACSLMVTRHFRPATSGRELFRRLNTDRTGTRQNAIVRELRASGVCASVRYDVDFDRLSRAIDDNKLVISYLHDIEHWIVVYGYARDPRGVYVADPRPSQDCVHAWDDYAPRLKGFGIICSAKTEPKIDTDVSRERQQLSFAF